MAGGKRERLVEGARLAFHENGVEATTLADVAAIAEVPVGNVYYYFKTKHALVEAVIADHARLVSEALDGLDGQRGPRERLKAFVAAFAGNGAMAARFGCPQGTLCSELDKQSGDLRVACSELMRLPIDWARRQFEALGRTDADELAHALIAAYQGMSLLTNTFGDPALIQREGKRLDRWIDSLAETS